MKGDIKSCTMSHREIVQNRLDLQGVTPGVLNDRIRASVSLARVARLFVAIHQSNHAAMATRDVMETWSQQSLTHSPKMLFFSIIAPTLIGLSRHAKLS